MRTRHAIALAALAASGCTWGEPDSLEILGVAAVPSPVVRGAKVLVSVTVSGLEPDVVLDFDDPGSSEVCAAVRVELRAAGQAPVPLVDARLASPTEILGRLEGNADKVLWDVAVVDASGRATVLPDAIEVLGCLPPNGVCDDGEDCTVNDLCNGAAFCTGTAALDGTPCQFACTTGDLVPGLCAAGACVPAAGLCAPPATCDPH
jgi:hypothetical protein